MPKNHRCAHCGSLDLAAGFDRNNCNVCGKQTIVATGLAPAEGTHYNDDSLDAACREWVTQNRPDVLAELANTVAGQPDDQPVPGTVPDASPDWPVVSDPAGFFSGEEPAPTVPIGEYLQGSVPDEPHHPTEDEIAAAKAVLEQAGA